MKKVLRVLLPAVVLLAAGSYATADDDSAFQDPGYSEPIHGTRVNGSGKGNESYLQEFMVFNRGCTENHNKLPDDKPTGRNTSILVKKRKDAEGNTWYTDYEQTSAGGRCSYLNRTSSDGTTYEPIYDRNRFPAVEGQNPGAYNDRILFRQGRR